jgi:hypothetical protein
VDLSRAATAALLATASACTPHHVAAHSDAGSEPLVDDAGPPLDAGCLAIGGLYAFASSSTCSGTYPPNFACIAQSGCQLAVTTDRSALSGELSGSTLLLEDPLYAAICRGEVSDGGLAMNCSLGGGFGGCSLQASPMAAPNGYEDVCCDLAKQDCATGHACRPGLISVGGGSAYANLCYQATGTNELNAGCTRDSSGGISADNCAAPLVCTRDGAPAGALACETLCEAQKDCGSGIGCLSVPESVPAGICVRTCDVFGAADACGVGQRCLVSAMAEPEQGTSIGEFCLPGGDGMAGAPCSTGSSCLAGLDCEQGTTDSTPVCHTYCDSAHPCSMAGQSCVPLSAVPAGDPTLGYCDPAW